MLGEKQSLLAKPFVAEFQRFRSAQSYSSILRDPCLARYQKNDGSWSEWSGYGLEEAAAAGFHEHVPKLKDKAVDEIGLISALLGSASSFARTPLPSSYRAVTSSLIGGTQFDDGLLVATSSLADQSFKIAKNKSLTNSSLVNSATDYPWLADYGSPAKYPAPNCLPNLGHDLGSPQHGYARHQNLIDHEPFANHEWAQLPPADSFTPALDLVGNPLCFGQQVGFQNGLDYPSAEPDLSLEFNFSDLSHTPAWAQDQDQYHYHNSSGNSDTLGFGQADSQNGLGYLNLEPDLSLELNFNDVNQTPHWAQDQHQSGNGNDNGPAQS